MRLKYRWLAPALCCGLLLTGLAGCGQQEEPVDFPQYSPPAASSPVLPEDVLPEDGETDAADVSPEATGAPALTLTAGNLMVEAAVQTDSWSYSQADGSVVICDYAVTETTALPLEDFPRLYTRQSEIQLEFANPPDSLSLRCWRELGWELAPEPLEAAFCDNHMLTLTLPEENCVYELSAHWQRPLYQGTARYLFRTSPEMSFSVGSGEAVEEDLLETLPFADNPQIYPLIVESGDAVRCSLSPSGGEDTVWLEMGQDSAEDGLQLEHFVINGMDYANALREAGLFFDTPDSAYAITDLDLDDNYLEIAVQEWGPSDDYATTFFRYDGSRLLCIGKAEGLVFSPSTGWSDIECFGDGTLSSYFRLSVLQTWYAEGQYGLNEQGWLTLLPRKEYESTRPISVTVLQTLSLWSDQAMEAGGPADAAAEPGQQLTLTGTDDRLWIHARTEDGASCWLKLAEPFALETPSGPLYGGEALEGLVMAD